MAWTTNGGTVSKTLWGVVRVICCGLLEGVPHGGVGRNKMASSMGADPSSLQLELDLGQILAAASFYSHLTSLLRPGPPLTWRSVFTTKDGSGILFTAGTSLIQRSHPVV